MRKIGLLFTLISLTSLSFAQGNRPLTLPHVSQKSEVKQTIGLSDVSITYNSPAVKGRKVLGRLVPIDKVWRCGANENTLIAFSHDAQVEGKNIPAGTYGLHMIAGKDKWTLIFSKNNTSWGSYTYRKDEDALRVDVSTKTLENSVEWLNFGFMNKEAESAIAYLEWDKILVPFKVSFDVKAIVMQNIKNELRSLPGFGNVAHLEAAQYCLKNNYELEQGLKWADRAIRVNPGFRSTSVKAGLLEKTGKKEEAKELMAKVVDTATEGELNTYGYQLLGNKDIKGAIAILQKNVKKHPKSWNAYDSLADAYDNAGDNAKKNKYYKLALANNPPADQKARIEGILK